MFLPSFYSSSTFFLVKFIQIDTTENVFVFVLTSNSFSGKLHSSSNDNGDNIKTNLGILKSELNFEASAGGDESEIVLTKKLS